MRDPFANLTVHIEKKEQLPTIKLDTGIGTNRFLITFLM